MLYQSEAFEPLTDERWHEHRVREAIREIVADTDAALRGPKLLWRADDWDRWHATSPMKELYVGSAGVIHALDVLRRRGHAETRLDLADLARRSLELFRSRPDFIRGWKLPEPREAALFTGETGILLVAWRLAPADGLADDLERLIRANVDNEANEVMWGSPGTMIAARAMLEWTGEERWRRAWDESAEALLARRSPDGLWTHRLYGAEYRTLTPPHGVVGNVRALLPLLDAERAERVKRETATVLARRAHVEDGIANWPPRDRPTLPGPDGTIRVQWCAGSPGIVVGAWDYLDEELLVAGAELAWRAGPHGMDKGSSICHGTAGNGYAFLKAFERTGSEEWLERARRFAVHALAQVARARTTRGRGRYSLWTGDLGAAIYAADCLDGRNAYPVFDTWD
ncbi:MAG: LanC-like protein [Actinomycetota bacterium]|nr:LanC-like protein [Actinomycetota bacterium]